MQDLLHLYRERSGDPGLWAEPFNAITNASFLAAALAAWALARRRGALTASTWTLIMLASSIGIGSFLFHTCVNHATKWLDVIPIAAFQVSFLWIAARFLLRMTVGHSVGLVVAVLSSSFLLMPLHRPLNGSLFYLPPLLAMVCLGVMAYRQRVRESWLILAAAVFFEAAIVSRSVDWSVPFSSGSHFVWHLLNGLVLYLLMRAWIVNVSCGASRNRFLTSCNLSDVSNLQLTVRSHGVR